MLNSHRRRHRFPHCEQTLKSLSVIKSYHWYSDRQFPRQPQVSKLMRKLHNFVAVIALNIGPLKLNALQYTMCVRQLYFDSFIMRWCWVLHLLEPFYQNQFGSRRESNVYTFVIRIDFVTHSVCSIYVMFCCKIMSHHPALKQRRKKQNSEKKSFPAFFSLSLTLFLSQTFFIFVRNQAYFYFHTHLDGRVFNLLRKIQRVLLFIKFDSL